MSPVRDMSWLEALAQALSPEECQAIFAQDGFPAADAAAQIHAGVAAAIYRDFERAIRLAEAGEIWAACDGDPMSLAYALRSVGHLAYLRANYQRAAEAYDEAGQLFAAVGAHAEVGRTLSSSLQSHSYLGHYELAEQLAEQARAIFEQEHDRLRLARLETNIGNIHFRRDRPDEAIRHYQAALDGFLELGDARDIAATFSNLAVSSTSLGLYREADRHYERAHECCVDAGLIRIAARADYNRAYLHYLRGDYSAARRLYDITRGLCQQAGDAYHAALCDLDEAELYLELNLLAEGEAMARRAAGAFAQLKMPYEQAKALVSQAIALSQRGNQEQADQTLRAARRLFVCEKNVIWTALADQLRAVLAYHAGRTPAAQRLSRSASRRLVHARIPGRAAYGQILLARLSLRAGQPDQARTALREALARPGSEASPSIRFHARVVEGEIHELQGRPAEAIAAYELARREIEQMRSRLDSEDLRISILADKLAVYEALVTLRLEGQPTAEAMDAALACVEQAKSRTLADRLSDSWLTSPEAPGGDTARDLRGLHRQIDRSTLAGQTALHGRLSERVAQIEAALPAEASGTTLGLASDARQRLQASLQPTEALLEYYEARGILYLFLLQRESFRAVRLGPVAPLRQAAKLLQFQLSLGPGRTADAAPHHLETLFEGLVAPVLADLPPSGHLIFAPHGVLHGIPFAALHRNGEQLIERYSVSLSPNASVLSRLRAAVVPEAGHPVVFAAPDAAAPQMEAEARGVASALPGSRLFVGPEATLEQFRISAPKASVLHLAAHGLFRRDNPLFSALQLADGPLTMVSLAQQQLGIDLMTLSACNSGKSVPVAGDELLGLLRACLAAGVRSLMVALWAVDDAAARAWMTHFYAAFSAGAPVAAAAREAMLALRAERAEPRDWAAFTVVGDPSVTFRLPAQAGTEEISLR
ncbi:MAG: CHAT domain-containing protein [Acidobacteria bacterium]|nr:CHAT domain-containing protein [Acidobacteriota bacterium]